MTTFNAIKASHIQIEDKAYVHLKKKYTTPSTSNCNRKLIHLINLAMHTQEEITKLRVHKEEE